jgi:hypothetical protein
MFKDGQCLKALTRFLIQTGFYLHEQVTEAHMAACIALLKGAALLTDCGIPTTATSHSRISFKEGKFCDCPAWHKIALRRHSFRASVGS